MITVVGAGLVGSLWAVLLRKRGFEVQVFEKRPDPRNSAIGAGRSINLVITSRGLYGLEKAGLLSEVTKLAVPVYGRMIHSPTGALTYQAYGQENECNLSISRDALNRYLITAAENAGAKIYFEHELQSLDATTKELKFSTPQGEKSAKYEVLFGADGAGSKVRKALTKISAGEIVEKTDWLEADYKELTLPLGKDGKPQLKTDALHIWPRGDHMMMALANKDGSFTVTMYLPKTAFEKLKTKESVESLFQKEFQDSIALMPNYIFEFLEHPQGTLGTVRTSKWVYQNSIALMGDAAHAIVPFFGQGMNAGFEDCTTLDSLLKKKMDWPEALARYEQIQKPNLEAIADMALENWVEMRDKVADKAFLLRKKVEGKLEHDHPTLYKSRYGLITYTLVPYALAQRAGEVQAQMLNDLIAGVDSFENVNWSRAERLLQRDWLPFVQDSGLKIQNYLPAAR